MVNLELLGQGLENTMANPMFQRGLMGFQGASSREINEMARQDAIMQARQNQIAQQRAYEEQERSILADAMASFQENPTPEGALEVMKVNPNVGMSLYKQLMESQEKQRRQEAIMGIMGEGDTVSVPESDQMTQQVVQPQEGPLAAYAKKKKPEVEDPMIEYNDRLERSRKMRLAGIAMRDPMLMQAGQFEEESAARSLVQKQKSSSEGERKQNVLKSAADKLQTSLQTLDRMAENEEGLESAVGIGSTWLTPSIPGSAASIFEKDFKQYEAQQLINVMMELKSLSKSGATGFGSTSEKEIDFIINSASDLGKGLSDKEFVSRLTKLRTKSANLLKELQKKAGIKPTRKDGLDDKLYQFLSAGGTQEAWDVLTPAERMSFGGN